MNVITNFNIYEQDKFLAQLSWVWKKFYNLGARPDKMLWVPNETIL